MNEEELDYQAGEGRGDNAIEAKETEGLSQGQIVWRKFTRHVGAMSALGVLLATALFAISAMGVGPIPGWWKYQDPEATHPMENGGAPSANHPFGQDNIGVDNFAAVMTGVKTSLLIMVLIGVTTLIVGVSVGALAGYYRGWLDNLLMRFTDLVITLPTLVIGAVLGVMVSKAPGKLGWSDESVQEVYRWMPVLLGIALGLILWPSLARLVRGEFLALREREFVDSARVAGASDLRIMLKHILPNSVGVIIVNVTLLMSSAVVLETALSFLGFGVRSPNISLGNLISTNQGAFATRPWLFWWPGLFIIIIALTVNFIGDGLRDAFDPRTKKIPSISKMRRSFAQFTKEQ
ncbi:MAG: ABC transporter permease [Propionibacteriaceae bacterium]|jgi:peptide/nickel transport system permease protein|nr:ABC transporter permease [Propionibacteriaceae bacterium]